MRTLRSPLGLALAFVLAFVGIAGALTFLRDDGGNIAPLCSFLDSSNAPAFCSTANPLPTAAGPLQSSSDPIGFGRAWFQSSGLPIPNARQWTGLMLDQNTVVALGPNGGLQLVVAYSRDGGRTFAQIYTNTSQSLGDPHDMIRLTDGTFAIAGDLAGNGAVFRTGDFSTLGNGSGLPAGVGMFTVRQNGATILANSSAGDICRSTNNGTSYSCVNPAALGLMSRQSLAPVSASRWIAIDDAGLIGLSTDDGVTWSNPATITAPDAFNHGVICLTATVCLATGGSTIVRSTDGGSTWGTATPQLNVTGSMPGRLAGFANFGGGVVVAVLAPQASATQPLSYRSTDFGVTWTPGANGTNATFPNGNGANAISTAGGGGFYMIFSSAGAGLPNSAGFYTVELGAGQQMIKGQSGATWEINANGAGIIVQDLNASPTLPTFGTTPFVVSTPVLNVGTNLTTTQTSAVASAQTLTLTGVASTRIYLYHASAFCAPAGTATLTIQGDGAVNKWIGPVPATPAVLLAPFDAPVQNGTVSFGQNMLLNVTTCGAGNTSTVNAIAMRY
jgi:hypothetical protein